MYDLRVQLSLLIVWLILQLCLFSVIRILICCCDFLACPQYGLACQSLNSWLALVAIPGLYLAQVLEDGSPCCCACDVVTLCSWVPFLCRAAQGRKAFTDLVNVQLHLGSNLCEVSKRLQILNFRKFYRIEETVNIRFNMQYVLILANQIAKHRQVRYSLFCRGFTYPGSRKFLPYIDFHID